MPFFNIQDYDPTTPLNNSDIGGSNIAEGCAPSGINNAMRELCSQIKRAVANQGADIASAATTNIGAATGQYVRVTGTTTITSLGTVAAGTMRYVEFTSTLTIAHNATSLILPGGVSIVTQAGDVGIFVSLGVGNWKCLNFLRASGEIARQGLSNITSAQCANIGTLGFDSYVTTDAASNVTTFGTGKAGAIKYITFGVGGNLIIHNATSLILPGGANITTQAGDSVVVQNLNDASNWRVLDYIRAANVPNRLLVTAVASTATTNIGAIDTETVQITGTTTITSFGTAIAGIVRYIEFTGSLTLTHSANLVLPGGANIATQAGDHAIAISYGSGVWKVANYFQNANIINASALPRGYISGFEIVKITSSDIGVVGGACRDDNDVADIIRSGSLVKKLNLNWVAGTNQGGLDTGTEAINTWYHVFAIRNPSTGAVDALISASATAPTMPSGYTQNRRVGSFRNDSSGNIVDFFQDGDEFLLSSMPLDVNTTTPGTTTVFATISVPNILYISALVEVYYSNSATARLLVSSPLVVSEDPNISFNLITSANSQACVSSLSLKTNGTSQINYRSSVSPVLTLQIRTRGWIDRRGQDD